MGNSLAKAGQQMPKFHAGAMLAAERGNGMELQ